MQISVQCKNSTFLPDPHPPPKKKNTHIGLFAIFINILLTILLLSCIRGGERFALSLPCTSKTLLVKHSITENYSSYPTLLAWNAWQKDWDLKISLEIIIFTFLCSKDYNNFRWDSFCVKTHIIIVIFSEKKHLLRFPTILNSQIKIYVSHTLVFKISNRKYLV